jgi:hypothetical protein
MRPDGDFPMTTISLTIEQAAIALERNIDRVNGNPRLRGACVELDGDVGVAADDLAESLREVPDPVRASLLAALDLPAGSSFGVVADVIKVMMAAPIVMTAEETADLERDAAVMSFVLDGDTIGRA